MGGRPKIFSFKGLFKLIFLYGGLHIVLALEVAEMMTGHRHHHRDEQLHLVLQLVVGPFREGSGWRAEGDLHHGQ